MLLITQKEKLINRFRSCQHVWGIVVVELDRKITDIRPAKERGNVPSLGYLRRQG